MCHKILSGNGSKLAVAALVWFFFRVPVVSFHVHINSKFVKGSMTTHIAQIVLLFILNQSPSSHCRIWIFSAITIYLWYLSVQSTLPWIMRINWKVNEIRKESKKTTKIPRRNRIIEFKHLKGQWFGQCTTFPGWFMRKVLWAWWVWLWSSFFWLFW